MEWINSDKGKLHFVFVAIKKQIYFESQIQTVKAYLFSWWCCVVHLSEVHSAFDGFVIL